ncbi:MAG TPA: sugar phosphate isomerase/epimerase family protein [Bryobacteraceae bacterium]|nr:sugar phosphate isomerase/epimerase family protein [Bryobacteraceae bacterium]HPT26505.1 sugar phosphate isomerase/epimerase family protein [Bryobacteraceae bacterium]
MSDLNAVTRRAVLSGLAALPAMAAKSRLKIGVTDWNLGKGANPESVALAASIGFEGVEISFGRPRPDEGRLPADRPETIAAYKAALAKHNIGVAGTCVDALHKNCLMNDRLGVRWVSDSIRLSRELGAKTLLLPAFFDCEVKTPALLDSTASALKEVAGEAERAAVTLGLENTLSAEENLRIMDKVGSRNLKVYYDAQNAIRWEHDPFKEIPLLGASRICQFHIKDNGGYLGEGKVPWDRLLQVIVELGFAGWANLETSNPSKDVPADMRRNLAYVRRLMKRKA